MSRGLAEKTLNALEYIAEVVDRAAINISLDVRVCMP